MSWPSMCAMAEILAADKLLPAPIHSNLCATSSTLLHHIPNVLLQELACYISHQLILVFRIHLHLA